MRFSEITKRFMAGTLAESDLSGVTAEDFLEARKDSGALFRMPNIGAEVRADKTGTGRRKFKHCMSSETACGPFKDVVLADAWDLTDFKKRDNPLLWAHDGSQPILGRVDNPHKSKSDLKLMGSPHFMPEGISDFADLVARMVDAGYMPGGSVGFRIEDARTATDAEAKQRKLGKHSMIITRASLSEYSIVPVGADPDSGEVRANEIRSYLSDLVQREEVDTALADHLIECLGIYEPLATRSIIVPDFTWASRNAAQDATQSEPTDAVDDEPDLDQGARDEAARSAEKLADLEGTVETQGERIAEQAQLIQEQSASIEELTNAVAEATSRADDLADSIEQATTRIEALADGVEAVGAAFGIEPVKRMAPVPEPNTYAALFDAAGL